MFEKVKQAMVEWKFRGWDATGQKGWVYGDLTHGKKVLKDEPYLTDRVMVGGYEVVPESVGICTGMKDKSGKDIYEGDIVIVRKLDMDFKEKAFRYGVVYEHGAFNIWATGDSIEVVSNRFEEK